MDVDISDLVQHSRACAHDLKSQPDRMRRILQNAAHEAQSHHAYQNRTGDLEASTQAVDVGEGADETTIDLVMAEEYASYVIDRGYSDFPDIEARAEQALAADVGDMMARAERG